MQSVNQSMLKEKKYRLWKNVFFLNGAKPSFVRKEKKEKIYFKKWVFSIMACLCLLCVQLHLTTDIDVQIAYIKLKESIIKKRF